MECSIPFDINTISDFLVYPTGCFYEFWLLILGFIWIVLVYSFYEKDEQRKTEGEMLSSMGVASIAVVALAAWGTFIKNSQDIPMIQNDIFLWILAPTIVFIGLWIYNK